MLQQSLNFSDNMTLDKMGSRYPSRLSFSRSMLRRLFFDNWKISKSRFDLDDNGYGTVVYEITINNNICLLYTSPSPRDLSTSRMPSSA